VRPSGSTLGQELRRSHDHNRRPPVPQQAYRDRHKPIESAGHRFSSSVAATGFCVVAIKSVSASGTAAHTQRGEGVIPLELFGSIVQVEARGKGAGSFLHLGRARLAQCDVSRNAAGMSKAACFKAGRQRCTVSMACAAPCAMKGTWDDTRPPEARHAPASIPEVDCDRTTAHLNVSIDRGEDRRNLRMPPPHSSLRHRRSNRGQTIGPASRSPLR